jgi:hypothetical protein
MNDVNIATTAKTTDTQGGTNATGFVCPDGTCPNYTNQSDLWVNQKHPQENNSVNNAKQGTQ